MIKFCEDGILWKVSQKILDNNKEFFNNRNVVIVDWLPTEDDWQVIVDKKIVKDAENVYKI